MDTLTEMAEKKADTLEAAASQRALVALEVLVVLLAVVLPVVGPAFCLVGLWIAKLAHPVVQSLVQDQQPLVL